MNASDATKRRQHKGEGQRVEGRVMQQQTLAQVGDKTMLDALVPAVDALREAVHLGLGAEEVLAKAAEAARLGAESTTSLQAKFGRARNLGPRSVGHADPGATSISLLFAGFQAAFMASE